MTMPDSMLRDSQRRPSINSRECPSVARESGGRRLRERNCGISRLLAHSITRLAKPHVRFGQNGKHSG